MTTQAIAYIAVEDTLVRFVGYVVVGVVVFFVLRLVVKRAGLDREPHDKIWISCLYLPEFWLFGVLFWPFSAIALSFCLVADFLHVRGKKEMKKAEALEATRDKRFDGLDLMERIDRLKAEVEKRK